MHTPDYPSLALHVAGRWITQASGGQRPVINPADESVLADLPLAGAAELAAAAESAQRGFASWRRTSALERFTLIRRATDLLRERAPAIARVLTLEQGKPLAEALREVTLSADIIDFQAEEAKRLYGRTVPPRVPGLLSQTVLRQPVGPVAAFTPWNFPMNLPARKLGSALAAGCSVVLKPAEETPATAMALVQCFLDAGLPPDVLNLVCGEPSEVSSFLIGHDAIRKVSFTGSVAVGRHLGELCARGVKRYTPELGGHAPVIVCADADLDFAVKASVTAKYRNAGQICASPIRFYVHASLLAAFSERFAAAARALRLGPGLEAATQMGPLTHARRVVEMQTLVDDALDHGARRLCGGQRAERPGWFFEPTLIADVPAGCRLATTEPFGPIATIAGFDTLDEAIALANDSRYGLGAYAFTAHLHTAHRLSEEIEAGMVGINHFGISQPEMPFGGWKDSGHGQEMGAEGLLAYTDLKTVYVGTPDGSTH
ncbi:NAD-dependent succinate-semialdehyde dehydrogenase [Ideonella sp. 4Y16]|uniref:NAD-dependent succinate-semialdehyde dehydrogenase n=1 Tax=Ideonella alba TaxID=2824118 RepID=UPI001B39C12A|nr:NAD-dependent succinate-semialdehyde dehydrogenase [Ideonella alba]MBQ0944529.1 NAD-dependent succinate-semialdehyde dehydrogenase [Ideonella alba]